MTNVKTKEIYYKEQQERITLFLKYNTKANTIKSVHFTSLKQGPMGDAVIKGYINNNKKTTSLLIALLKIIFNFKVI